MLKRKSNLTIDKPNKRVRPVEKENEDANVSDSDQEDQLVSNQVNAERHVFIIKLLYINASVVWTNVTFIFSGV